MFLNRLSYEWRIHDMNQYQRDELYIYTHTHTRANYYLFIFHKYNCLQQAFPLQLMRNVYLLAKKNWNWMKLEIWEYTDMFNLYFFYQAPIIV